jgi:hypothetical protein
VRERSVERQRDDAAGVVEEFDVGVFGAAAGGFAVVAGPAGDSVGAGEVEDVEAGGVGSGEATGAGSGISGSNPATRPECREIANPATPALAVNRDLRVV